jgi:O-antigen ligase
VTAVVIGLAAAYVPLLSLAFAAAMVVAVVMVGNLTYGVVVFTLLTFFEVLPGLNGVALSKPVGMILVASWLLALARDGRSLPLLSRDRPALAFILFAFVGWAVMSAGWAPDSAVALSSSSRIALIALLVLAVVTGLRTPRDLTLVAWAFVSGAFLVSVVAIATGGNKAGRLALGELDPNQLAASIAAALVLALFLLVGTARRDQRLVLLLYLGTYVVTIMLTESRGAIVACAVGGMAAIVVAGPFRARIVPIVLIIAACGVVYYAVLAPSGFRERVTQAVATERDPRLDSWSIARRVWEEHPVAGVGLGNFVVVEQGFLSDQISLYSARKLHNIELVSHNTYLDVLTELGLIGFVLFSALITAAAGSALEAVRRVDTRDARLGLTIRGLLAALVTLLTAYFFVSELYGKQLWLLLAVVAAAPTIIGATEQAQPAVESLAETRDDGSRLPGAPGSA